MLEKKMEIFMFQAKAKEYITPSSTVPLESINQI